MIDIIIPIYDGFIETKECLTSLRKTKSNLDNQIILINDNSPNDDIRGFLEGLKRENLSIINNQQNLGFVKSVNKGIKLSNNDVILLNSDTIVTDYFIDKLHSAAYSSHNVGTVTSLTNNGTIASVPLFNTDNELPEGYTIQEFSNLIEKLSSKVYPRIPTAVGHCIYIKRDVIEKVGYFDEDTFGTGYCEEEDFSCRVIKQGYKNILADDTFIFHYGSTSFKKNKLLLIKKNKKLLRKKHWWHPFNVKRFLIFDKRVKRICLKIHGALKH